MKGLLLALFALTPLVFAQDATLERVGISPVEANLASGGHIRMDLCSSGIELVGTDEKKLRVSYEPEQGDVKVRMQVSGDRAVLSVSDCPRNNFRITIEVPKSTDLYVRMMAGELSVRDIVGDKDMELHFGHLNMEVGDAQKYGRVEASVNSGALQASAFGVSKGGLFRSFDQKGPGQYRLYAHVGAGELDLR
ncbi:MAG TPA: hypothetical protein VGG04_10245 [Candidatus Sulfotelmatobacter sp.]|jgi:hypothetical protein